MCYWITRLILKIILKLFFRLKVEGLQNLPKKGNFIVVANHTSFLDPLVIAAAIPKKIYWITLRGIYRAWGLRWVMKIGEALPTGSASNKAVYLLKQNKNVGLFPEGTRSYDGKLKEFRRGAMVLALKTGRPLVPCAILGAYEAFPRRAQFPKFRAIKVKIGSPKYLLKEFDEVIDDTPIGEGALKIRNVIKEMLNAG